MSFKMENVVDGRIDGRAVAEKTRDNVAAAVASLDITPTLAVVLVGDERSGHALPRTPPA